MSSRFQPPHDPRRPGHGFGAGEGDGASHGQPGSGADDGQADDELDDGLEGPFDPAEGLSDGTRDLHAEEDFEVDQGPLDLPGEGLPGEGLPGEAPQGHEAGVAGGVPSISGPGMSKTGGGSGVFGHVDGRLDVLERRDRFQIFAHLPETEADGVRVTLEGGALTILARRGQGDRPLGWGVRLVFGDQVDGELRSVLQDDLLLVELPKAVPDDVPAPGGDEAGGRDDDTSAN